MNSYGKKTTFKDKIGNVGENIVFFLLDFAPWIMALLALVTIALVALMLIIPMTDHNTDPRKGTVYIDSGTKECDGANLVYQGSNGLFSTGSLSVVANSPECRVG